MQKAHHQFQKELKLTNGGNGGDDLSQFQLIQDGCLTSSIESHLQTQASSQICSYMQSKNCMPCFGRTPTMRMRISFLEKRRANNFVKANPILKQPFLQPRYTRYANNPASLVPTVGLSALTVPFGTGFLKFSPNTRASEEASVVTGKDLTQRTCGVPN